MRSNHPTYGARAIGSKCPHKIHHPRSTKRIWPLFSFRSRAPCTRRFLWTSLPSWWAMDHRTICTNSSSLKTCSFLPNTKNNYRCWPLNSVSILNSLMWGGPQISIRSSTPTGNSSTIEPYSSICCSPLTSKESFSWMRTNRQLGGWRTCSNLT